MIHGDYAAFVAASGLHSVTQYELQKAIWSSLNDVNFFELSRALDRHVRFCRAFVPVTFVGNHDVTRILSRLRDPSRLGHALAVLFTVPGSPCVYYGDELGMRGVKENRAGGDDAIRPAFPPSPAPATAEEAAILGLYRQLAGMRRARPWLTEAGIAVKSLANAHLQYVVSAGDRALLVRLNAGDTSVTPDDAGRAWRRSLACRGSSLAGMWAILEGV
jgi:glycosidase